MASDTREQDLQAFIERRPIPDPTTLTLAMMQRELAALKEVIATRLDGMDRAMILFNENIMRVPSDTDKQVTQLKALHDERFTAVQQLLSERDTRVELMASELRRLFDATMTTVYERLRQAEVELRNQPAAIAAQLAQLQALQEEKFTAVQVRFEERAEHTATLVTERNIMWGNALQAAKDAVTNQHLASTEAVSKAEKGMVKQVDQLTELFRGAINAMEAKLSDLKERLVLIEGRTVGLTSAQSTQQGSQAHTASIISIAIAALGLIAGVIVALVLKR